MADNEEPPKGSGQRVTENTQRVGRGGTARGAQGRAVPSAAPGAQTPVSARPETPPTPAADEAAPAKPTSAAAAARRAQLAAAPLMVRATATGYYHHAIRREGDVFALVPLEGQLSEVVRDPKTGDPLLDKRGHKLTRQVEGVLSPEQQFTASWMQLVNADEAVRVSTAQDALNKEHDRILSDRAESLRRGASGRFNDQTVTG